MSLANRPERIKWQQDSVAGVPLQRFVGTVGPIAVADVSYDGANGFWVWVSPLQEDAWGYGPSKAAAKAAVELWLVSWLKNFRTFFEQESAARAP